MNNSPVYINAYDYRWASDTPLYNSALAFKNKLIELFRNNRKLETVFEFGKNYLSDFEKGSPSINNKLLLYCTFTGFYCENIFKRWDLANSTTIEVIKYLKSGWNIFKANGFIIGYDYIYYLHFNLANILLLSTNMSSVKSKDRIKKLDEVRRIVSSLGKPPVNGKFRSVAPNKIFRNCQLWILAAKSYEISYRNKSDNFFLNITKCQEWIENISNVFLSSYLNRMRVNEQFAFFNEATWNKFDYYSLRKNRSIKRYSDNISQSYEILFNTVSNFCRDVLHRAANVMIHLGYFDLAEHIFLLLLNYPISKSMEYTIRSDIAIMILENNNLYRAITELEKIRSDLTDYNNRSLFDNGTIDRLPKIETKIQILKSHFGLTPVYQTETGSDLSENEYTASKELMLQNYHDYLDKVISHNYPLEILFGFEKFANLISKSPDYVDNSIRKHYLEILRVLVNKWSSKYPKANSWELNDFPKYSGNIPLNVYQSNLIIKYLFEFSQMFHPARCPRLLIRLIKFKIYFNDELNEEDRQWGHWHNLAIKWSSKLGEIHSLFSTHELAKRYDENLLSINFYKTLISHTEFVDSKLEWGYNLSEFINISHHILVDAAFYMALNSRNDFEWIFRAIELFKSRFLLSIRRNVKYTANPLIKDLYEISLEEFFISAKMPSKENIPRLQERKEVIIDGLQKYSDSEDIYYDVGPTWIKPIVSRINKHHQDKTISIVSLTSDQNGQCLLATIIDNIGLNESVVIDLKVSITDLVKACWRDISQRSNTQFSALSYLNEVVVKPVSSILNKSDIIYFSFDETTLNLPIHSAFSNSEKRFFIQNQRIAYIPSVKLLSYLLSYERFKASNILIECSKAAGGLAHKEALLQIAQPISNRTISKLDEINYSSIVYLSGHGSQTSDLFFEYLIADENNESTLNKLSAKDILELENDVRCQLFFLNSCSLGLDKQFLKESIGFSFAIMARRAQSCILAAAPVQTDFAQFYSKQVFSQLFGSVDIHVIMQNIIKELPEKWKHPFYWAPYILIGDYRKILH